MEERDAVERGGEGRDAVERGRGGEKGGGEERLEGGALFSEVIHSVYLSKCL